jgi:hypothetical protein
VKTGPNKKSGGVALFRFPDIWNLTGGPPLSSFRKHPRPPFILRAWELEHPSLQGGAHNESAEALTFPNSGYQPAAPCRRAGGIYTTAGMDAAGAAAAVSSGMCLTAVAYRTSQ